MTTSEKRNLAGADYETIKANQIDSLIREMANHLSPETLAGLRNDLDAVLFSAKPMSNNLHSALVEFKWALFEANQKNGGQ